MVMVKFLCHVTANVNYFAGKKIIGETKNRTVEKSAQIGLNFFTNIPE